MEQVFTASFYGPFRMITKQKDIQYPIEKEETTVRRLSRIDCRSVS